MSSRQFHIIHYDSLPEKYKTKSCVSSLSSLTEKEYDTLTIDPFLFPPKKWEDYRFDYEVKSEMHPFAKFDPVTHSVFAVNDSETWKKVGFLVGYLIFSERDIAGKQNQVIERERTFWWFQDYPQVSCEYIPEANDVILVLECFLQSPPLTQSRSLFASTYTLQQAFKKFMYLPSLKYNGILRDMIMEDVYKWDKDLYKDAEKHPSTLPDDLISFQPVYGRKGADIVSVFIELFLKSVSDRYYLPMQVIEIPERSRCWF